MCGPFSSNYVIARPRCSKKREAYGLLGASARHISNELDISDKPTSSRTPVTTTTELMLGVVGQKAACFIGDLSDSSPTARQIRCRESPAVGLPIGVRHHLRSRVATRSACVCQLGNCSYSSLSGTTESHLQRYLTHLSAVGSRSDYHRLLNGPVNVRWIAQSCRPCLSCLVTSWCLRLRC